VKRTSVAPVLGGIKGMFISVTTLDNRKVYLNSDKIVSVCKDIAQTYTRRKTFKDGTEIEELTHPTVIILETLGKVYVTETPEQIKQKGN
jgi:hypothetical protein